MSIRRAFQTSRAFFRQPKKKKKGEPLTLGDLPGAEEVFQNHPRRGVRYHVQVDGVLAVEEQRFQQRGHRPRGAVAGADDGHVDHLATVDALILKQKSP